MKTGLIAITAGLATLTLATPALAGDRNDRGDRREWRDDRRDNARAYQRGYRDGVRADKKRERERYRYQSRNSNWRGPASSVPYTNNSRWNNGYGVGQPVYYGNAYPRNVNSNYYWGDRGHVYCRRSDGTTGVIVGALAGGTLGNVLAQQGDKRLGSVIGGTLGAIIGREIDRGNARCR
ncbi:glycine zipper 2TM domain-containing protein [Sandaracinobacteroides sp. A072]|uniref:glycine zipper 2TM domain-containing protein n=1 Tax=Sandaracinobacteroides sp. A072 TaxID=3461146 RepID=UPI00404193E4